MNSAIEGADLGIILGTLIGALTGLSAFTWTIFKIARGVAAINVAVNHQDEGEPTLIERVKTFEKRMDRHEEAAQRTADRVGGVETQIVDLASAVEEIRAAVNRIAPAAPKRRSPPKGTS